MDPAVFDWMEQEAGDPEAVFDRIAEIARREKNDHLLFGSRMMRLRLRLGLPLIDTEELPRLSKEQRSVYEQAFGEAAREAGELLLAEGDIAGAWRYFDAVGEPARVAAAIDRVIQIAYQEGVHRLKGFELCLKHHGICTAITWFGANPDSETREQCLEMLVASLYGAVAAAIRET